MQGFKRRGFWVAAICLSTSGAPAVTITEINYHPPKGSENLEFLEISNDLSSPEDISGWSFVEGISFTFPPGTVLGSRGIIVVALDPAALKNEHSITNVAGPFTGRLDSSGERVTLVNHAGGHVLTVHYEDDGKWPAGADGTGHTLALASLHLDAAEPESWVLSAQLGGTPGRVNFSGSGPTVVDRVIVDEGVSWRYRKGTAPFSDPISAWHEADFDDAGWTPGPSGFGFGDNDDATILDDMLNAYLTVAARLHFNLTAEQLAAPGEFYLGMDFDDGFVAYLNGQEIARINAGGPGEERAHDATSTAAREAGVEDVFKIARNLLIEGENVLAVAGYNFSIGSSDFSLIPRLILRETITPSTEGGLKPVVFNEFFRGATAGAGWVELYNAGRSTVDLGGHVLTDDPERTNPYTFPAGTGLASGKFLTLTETATGLLFSAPRVQLFLLDSRGFVAAASTFNTLPPPGVVVGGYTEGRIPDGGPSGWVMKTPTPSAANTVPLTTDIVINEIFYHPPEERTGEFIELFNRGSSPVNLSGFRFDKGIDLTITAGTVLQPGKYLVVSEDPALIAERYGITGVQGPWTGRLADRGEKIRLVDALGNPVDEVRYYDGGQWSQWGDGGGSSLELIDPWQDNSLGAAWDGSDESDKAEWENWTFKVARHTVAQESELWIYFQEKGVCHVDDVSITRAGGANLIPNPGFEVNTASWSLLGTHVRSKRVDDDSHTGAACLEVDASGKGDTLANHVEVETNPRLSAGEYDVSLWVRWLRGGSLLIVQTPYSAGTYSFHPSPATNLSGNTLSLGRSLAIPFNLGTPGAENSATGKLIEANGSDNLGPLIAKVRQTPVSPSPSQPANVTAIVSDSDGVQTVQLHYRQNDANGAFTPLALADDGAHGDGEAGDGVYGGEIPGFTANIRIVFYIEAVDALGAARRYPLDAPAHTCLYQVQGPPTSAMDQGRIVLDGRRTQELSSRPLHSNDLLDGSFVINDEEIYYNVGVRYRGSPWGRPGRNNYRVRFEEDHTFWRDRKAINLDNSGGGPNEGAAYFMVRRNGIPSRPTPVGEYYWIGTWVNGGNSGTHALMQPIDRDYITTWYGSPDEAQAWKVEGRRVLDDAGNLLGWDGMTYVYRTEDKENYRGYLIPGIRQSVDDWSQVALLCNVMDQRVTPNATFDTQIHGIMDVEELLRCLAPRILFADWDAFSIGNGHNGYLILDPRDQRFELIPHDMDNTFGGAAPNLFPTFDPNIGRLMSRPYPKRMYYRILSDYLKGYWNASVAGPFFDAVQTATGLGTSGIKSFLTTTGNSVKSALTSVSNVPFRIVTNNGNNLETESVKIDLEGDAPIQVETILLSVNEGEQHALNAAWTTPTRWKMPLDLLEGSNALVLQGYDSAGALVGITGITIFRGPAGSLPTVTDWTPRTGTDQGGTEVTLTGTHFAAGVRVYFGNTEATPVTIDSPTRARVVTPRAPIPFPTGGVVDVQVVFSAASRVVLTRAFTYVKQKGFVRGDANGNLKVEMGDAIQTLFYLYNGQSVPCVDAADFNDSGSVGITDVIGTLEYLFRQGPEPKAPFPAVGEDPTADSFVCS